MMATLETRTRAPADSSYALGFSSLNEEVEVENLPVLGELPAWLRGRLIRVTPALLEIGDRRWSTGSTDWRC
jgi:beta,beta-carotene 9',10'-dioxygenase